MTTEPKHTPAPWRVERYTNYIGWSVYAGTRGCIAERWYDTVQEAPYADELKANAELIASAPSLLADNERLREALRKAYSELNIIRARDGVPYCHDGRKSDVCPEYFSSVVEEARAALSATGRNDKP